METLDIEDPHVFELLTSPIRLRLLRELLQPRSVKELAEALGVHQTRLYYHVNLLHRAGLIEVIETRKVGAALEKVYRTRARHLRPSQRLLRGGHDPHTLARVLTAAVFDLARVDAETALTAAFAAGAEPEGTLGRSQAVLGPRRAREFQEKARAILRELESVDDPEGVEYGLTVAFFPVGGGDR